MWSSFSEIIHLSGLTFHTGAIVLGIEKVPVCGHELEAQLVLFAVLNGNHRVLWIRNFSDSRATLDCSNVGSWSNNTHLRHALFLSSKLYLRLINYGLTSTVSIYFSVFGLIILAVFPIDINFDCKRHKVFTCNRFALEKIIWWSGILFLAW